MNESNRKRRELLEREFESLFGAVPDIWLRAPGRVDLMGSHTDYNKGYVLTLSIDRDTWIAARRRADGRVRIESLELPGGGDFDLSDVEHDQAVPWTNYVRGVAHALAAEGRSLTGFDGLVHSTVPLRGGLSSSAALEVATAVLFQELGGWGLDPIQLAIACQRAENEFVGMSCGILDQYTSILGRSGCALLLDCRSLESEPVPLHPDLNVVICDTRCKRELTGSEYPDRRAQCEEGARRLAQFSPSIGTLRDVSADFLAAHRFALPDVVARRCRFIVEENMRVLDLARGLNVGDCQVIRELTSASFAGARDLYEIVSPEMETMWQAMMAAPGAIGARQAGAGFGGCMVAVVERSRTVDFSRSVRETYGSRTSIDPAIFAVEAAPGAGRIEA